MSFDEIGHTTLRQARMLMANVGKVDGYRHIADTLIDVAVALSGGKRDDAPQADVDAPGGQVQIAPVLLAVIKSRGFDGNDALEAAMQRLSQTK